MTRGGDFVTVGTCRVCEEGLLGVRVCSDAHDPLVICVECESIWTSPACEGTPQATKDPESQCPVCSQPIFSPTSHWADEQKIDELGWSSAITQLPNEPDSAN